MSDLEYDITNVGGVEHIKLNLKPGVSILRGRNGIGKTSAINAVARAQGAKVRVEKRDGAPHGFVTGPGVKMAIKSVASVTGEAEIELADTGPLAKLIDPGIKDTELAAKARIKALVELLRLGVDDEHLNRLCGGDEAIALQLRDRVQGEGINDLMEAAEKLRSITHSLARSHEREAEEAELQAKLAADKAESSLAEAGGTNPREKLDLAPSPLFRRDELDEATRKHERAVARCEAREGLERQQTDIRKSLGSRPNLIGALSEQEKRQKAVKNTAASIAALEGELRDLKSTLMVHTGQLEAADKVVEDTKANLSRWEQQQTVLEESIEDAPTRDEVETMRVELVESAREALRLAELGAVYRAEEKTRRDAERVAEDGQKAATGLRALALGIPEKLGEILASSGAPGLTVKDGRLHAIRPDGTHDFETRCSTGQRVALALDVAVVAYEGKVLPLDGELWASLDPEHRELFNAEAIKRGLVVITEEPAEGELRVERVGA